MGKKLFVNKIPSRIKDPVLVEERRNQIFECARDLFCKKGYHGTGIREFSKEAEISLGNLYNYISTKEDILSIVHEKTFEIVLKALREGTMNIPDPEIKIKRMINIELSTMDEYRDLIMLLYQESHILSQDSLTIMLKNEEMHVGMFKEVIEDGMAEGVFHCGNPLLLAHIIKVMIDSWVLKRWAFKGIGIEDMENEIMGLLEHGLLRPQIAGEGTPESGPR